MLPSLIKQCTLPAPEQRQKKHRCMIAATPKPVKKQNTTIAGTNASTVLVAVVLQVLQLAWPWYAICK
ncbi:hypothetical protein OC25_05425 [Pedobacter kyungheensis]|uniref:Uncharacterized protein n=1 Tax=Pedobacter kyungheensis TaxID=1069985 RepID=A0A0C1DE80_9SPHI|nr:hypothetical protein OC25_05425 [Pedobacter kyungheensis]